ncbi:restriction endonuclease subunit S [Campylobacter sp.]|uniref:restriction endonuclease subunit S n=1 Tax=Campylobacter sp. TaxID=205 RepID=UPI00259C6B71|nr:restriction endonuclease subunit S [Campylobacter sp.]MBQ7136199.1 restriction endonuclease subunit S [Campylobacter sp.]
MNNQNMKFKDSQIAWIGQIPKDWEISKIKYVANLFTGNSISDSQKNNFTNSENSLPYIATKDIELDTNLVNYKNGMYIPKLNSSFKIAPKNSILLCIEGGSAGRKISFTNKDVCFVNKLCCFVAKPDFSKKFLYYYCQNPSFISEFKLNLIGLIGGVSINNIKNFRIPLLPLNEQKEIAEFLDKKCEIIDKRLSNLERKIKSLKEYKKSLISECVTKGLNPKNKEFKDSGIPWIGQIPKHWEIRPLYFYFNERKNKNLFENEKNLLSLSYGKIIRKNIETKDGLLPENFNGYNIIEKDDIVFRLTDLQNDKVSLRTGLVKEKGIITSAYVTIKPKQKICIEFYHYLLHCYDLTKVFYNFGNGVRQNLTYKELSKMKILVPPPLNEQKEIAEFLDKKCEKIDRLNENYTKQIDTLKEYKKSIIYECVTGKKEI